MPVGYPSSTRSTWRKSRFALPTLGLAKTLGTERAVWVTITFSSNAWNTTGEREAMSSTLDKVSTACVCAWLTARRMQHMFWSYLDRDPRAAEIPASCHAMRIYSAGRSRGQRSKAARTMLMVISTCFNSFRARASTSIDGSRKPYLKVDDAPPGRASAGVDWSQNACLRHRLTGIL